MRNKSRTTLLILRNIIHISISAADPIHACECWSERELIISHSRMMTRFRFGSMSPIKMHIISNKIEFILIPPVCVPLSLFFHTQLYWMCLLLYVLLQPLVLIFMPIKKLHMPLGTLYAVNMPTNFIIQFNRIHWNAATRYYIAFERQRIIFTRLCCVQSVVNAFAMASVCNLQ